MEIVPYLAMTPAEFSGSPQPDKRVAWMACHFSSHNSGLSNIPAHLPEDSILILDDSYPIQGHEPTLIFTQLQDTLLKLGIQKLLLDFQRPYSEELNALVHHLQSLPCQVAVTESYAKNVNCPIFLPPVPLHKTAEAHVQPWEGREIWLEIAPMEASYLITEQGCEIDTLPAISHRKLTHYDAEICTHYHISITNSAASFLLRRTVEDVKKLLQKADGLGIDVTIGLYQELME